MMSAISLAIIGVLGTGFISVLVLAIRMLSSWFNSLESRFDRLEDRFDRSEDRFDKFRDETRRGFSDIREEIHKGFREHGERLARIEAHLEIDPPAEAA